MKLTNRLLKRLIAEEHERLTPELVLRKEIKKYVQQALKEAGEMPKKAGTQGAGDTEGNVDVKKLADALGVQDPGKLKTSIANLRKDKRNTNDDKLLGDMVAKLLSASSEDTVKAMNVLKKVSSEEDK